MDTTTQPTELRDTADALGVIYPRVWDPAHALSDIRRGARDKASYWLGEIEAGRGYPTTLEYVRDLMDLVHAADEQRAAAFTASTRASVDDVAEALLSAARGA